MSYYLHTVCITLEKKTICGAKPLPSDHVWAQQLVLILGKEATLLASDATSPALLHKHCKIPCASCATAIQIRRTCVWDDRTASASPFHALWAFHGLSKPSYPHMLFFTQNSTHFRGLAPEFHLNSCKGLFWLLYIDISHQKALENCHLGGINWQHFAPSDEVKTSFISPM